MKSPSLSQSITQTGPRLLGIASAAHYLGATPWFVRTLIWERRIAFCRLGKRLLIDRTDLDSFIASAKEGAR
jgi:excisionase family DNA binding protein